MPYFVYKMSPNKHLEHLQTFSKYREARDYAREQRKAQAADDDHIIKMIHAKHTAEAERLLSSHREPRPLGEDA